MSTSNTFSSKSGVRCSTGPGYKRFIVAWLSCVGLLTVLAMRSEMGIAIIKMTKKTKEQIVVPPDTINGTKTIKTEVVQEVAWNHLDVGLIEASFFVGYAVFSVPAGYLTSIVPSNLLLGVSVFVTCGLNMLVPTAAHITTPVAAFACTLVLRILQGAAEGCLYPAVHGIWRHWAPSGERSKLVTISFFGMALGPIVGLPLTGAITTNYGWPLNFYIYGTVGIVWAITWFLTVYEYPSADPYISNEECDYIELHNPSTKVTTEIPFTSIFTSLPVWAIIFANIGRNWSFQFSTIGLPAYFLKVYDLTSEQVGIYMCVPFLIMALFTPLGGALADLTRRNFLSTTNTRRLFNTVGFGTAAIGFFVVSFSRDLVLSTLLLTVCFGFTGLGMSGYGVNHLDIAPRYAGFLMGVSNGFGTISGVLSPIVASPLTKHGTAEEWQIIFILAALVHTVTVIAYAVLVSGELQQWAMELDEDEKQSLNLERNEHGTYGTVESKENENFDS